MSANWRENCSIYSSLISCGTHVSAWHMYLTGWDLILFLLSYFLLKMVSVMNELHCHKKIVTYLTKTLKWLLYDITRNAFQAIKTSKEGSPKVFNKYTKSYFSNFEYGRSPDQENVRLYFFTESLRLVASYRNTNSHWAYKIKKSRGSQKIFDMEVKCSKHFINEIKCIMFTSLRTNSMAGRLDHTILFASPTK